MSRHSAREKSIMFLYQIEVRDGNVHKIKEMFLSQYPIDNVDDREYFNFLVDGVIEHMKSIDDIIFIASQSPLRAIFPDETVNR
jgi:transcription termination factor NusB